MDKLKSITMYVKKFGFWFLLGLIVVMVLSCWWVGTSSVASVIKSEKEKIDGTVKQVAGIISSPPPNQKYIDALKEENKTSEEKVYSAWRTLYEEQKKNNPWFPVLGPEFLEMINDENRKPEDEIRLKYRETYLNFIQQSFPELFKIVDLRRPKDEDETADAKKTGQIQEDPNKPAEMIGIVDWDPGDIARLKSQFNWQTTPSDLKVKLAQEDLWVYLSLLRVIKNTNGSVTEHSKAAIKHIDALEIGARAVAAWGAAEGKVFTGAAASGNAASAETKASVATAAGNAAPNEDDVLKQSRYVDDKGEPLAADAKSPYNEFKMMPIRMRIYIDQRKLPKLLAECANSAMPIEVRRVRIKPDEGEVVDLSSMSAEKAAGGAPAPGGMPGMPGMPGGRGVMPGMPGMPGGMPGYGPMMPGMPGGMRGYGEMMRPGGPGGYPGGGGAMRPAGSTEAGGWDKSPMDIPVEIHGIICIYLPPDKEKMGKGAAGETAAAATAPAGTTPAATPVPATTPATPPTAPAANPTAPTATPTAPTATPTAPTATPAAPAAAPAATPIAAPLKKG